jgi:ankyrin repeat protein
VKILLAAGANPAAGPGTEIRPLRSASERGHVRVVRQLLAAGAPADQNGDWALMEACGNGHAEVARLLIKAGAHADAANSYALFLAWTNGYHEIVSLLKKAGARWPSGKPPVPRDGTSHTAMDVTMAGILWTPKRPRHH